MSKTNLMILTLPFIIISHYVAVYPHEFTHSFLAWALGYKSNPLNIQYGGIGLSNLLLMSDIDENVNYEAVSQNNPYHAALIAFAGPFMNVLLFFFFVLATAKETDTRWAVFVLFHLLVQLYEYR